MHEKFVKKELKEHYFSLQKVKKEQGEWDSNHRCPWFFFQGEGQTDPLVNSFVKGGGSIVMI